MSGFLSQRELDILAHIRRFGSDGYGAYITKRGHSWHVEGCPTVFWTKHEAVAQFERYLDALHMRRRQAMNPNV